jgi:hypothetical protein
MYMWRMASEKGKREREKRKYADLLRGHDQCSSYRGPKWGLISKHSTVRNYKPREASDSES